MIYKCEFSKKIVSNLGATRNCARRLCYGALQRSNFATCVVTLPFIAWKLFQRVSVVSLDSSSAPEARWNVKLYIANNEKSKEEGGKTCRKNTNGRNPLFVWCIVHLHVRLLLSAILHLHIVLCLYELCAARHFSFWLLMTLEHHFWSY